jgi:hypothetical protein
MAFWTNLDKEPKRSYRFLLADNAGVWWYATNVSKPSVTINTTEHRLINHHFKYPTTGVWNDINISIIDPSDKSLELYKTLKDTGFYSPNISFTDKTDGISKKLYSSILDKGAFVIQQVDSKGQIIEQWSLHGAFITDLKFGELNYGADDFVKLDITIKYDWATLTDGSTTTASEGSEEVGTQQ